MERLKLYLGTAAFFAFLVLLIIIADQASVSPAPVSNAPAASSTLSVVPDFALPAITLPSVEFTATAATASSAPVLSSSKQAAPAAPKPAPASAPTPVPVAAPLPVSAKTSSPTPDDSADFDATASALRSALVNIICYAPAGSSLRSTSGSGIFIDSKGIILTNAHIALNFLLKDRGVSCDIRAGSPATDRYEASLIYIPPAWINANASILAKTAPRGTGEYDFALLGVTKSAEGGSASGGSALSGTFPFVPLALTPPAPGTPVIIASYGAQFLESSQIQSALFPTIVFGSVKDVFTFATNTIDVLALGGSAAAQEGSSGGGVAGAVGELVGTITTSTIEGTTDTRSLDAITASYIRVAYASETGQALDLLLAEPVTASIAAFAPQLSALEAILTANLP